MRAVRVLLILALSLTVARSGSAEETNPFSVGFRTSVSSHDKKHRFNQYDLFVNRELPWSWQLQGGWDVTPRLEATAGVLKGAGETGFVVSLGPTLALSGPGDRIVLDIGVSPTLMNRHEFGTQNFGKAMQFTSHASIDVEVVPNLRVGYRFQHMSNASLSSINPGLELHMLAVSYRF
jgi:hypothetical protein